MTNVSTTMAATVGPDDSEDSISFFSLMRKLGAFTMLIFMFHLAFPLSKANAYLIGTLGIEHAWYSDVPLALFVAAFNSLLAVLAFKFVK